MKRHAVLDSASLATIVDVARGLREKEEEQKQRDKEQGRRNEIDDLPPGHPLKIQQEEAKKRHEERVERVQQAQKAEIKTAKKLTPHARPAADAVDPEHVTRVRISNNHNGATQAILKSLEEYRAALGNTHKAFQGFPNVRVKLDRASRAVVAACYAIHEATITISERG
jgi:hypothetical protein